MPTIAELITAYRDRTGTPSYEDMARKVRDEIKHNRIHQMHTKPPKSFAEARTMELLAELLEVPVATIVLAYAASLGIPVRDSASELARTLPPGTEKLTIDDRDAIRAITKALIDARRDEMAIIEAWQKTLAEQAEHPELEPTQDDFTLAARRGASEGQRLRQQQDEDAES